MRSIGCSINPDEIHCGKGRKSADWAGREYVFNKHLIFEHRRETLRSIGS